MARVAAYAYNPQRGQLPPLVLLVGDDSGHVRELAQKTISAAVDDPADPFAVDRLTLEDLANRPGALLESAATMPFGGGIRLVRVEGYSPELTGNDRGVTALGSEVKDFLDNPPADAVVVIPAPGLTADSALVRNVSKDKTAVVVTCYAERARDLGSRIDSAFPGRRVQPDARRFLVENLGNDRGITQSELDKLDLFTHGKDTVTLEDCLLAVAAAPSINIFKLRDAIAQRDRAAVDSLTQALAAEGESLYAVLMGVLSHLRQLLAAHRLMAEEGLNPLQAAAKFLPPKAPKEATDAFVAGLKRYNPQRLKNVFKRVYDMVYESRQAITPGELSLERGLLALGS